MTFDRDEIKDIAIVGKERKNFKVVCRDLEVKNKILTFARQRKPKDIFISEFLTPFGTICFTILENERKVTPMHFCCVYTGREYTQ